MDGFADEEKYGVVLEQKDDKDASSDDWTTLIWFRERMI